MEEQQTRNDHINANADTRTGRRANEQTTAGHAACSLSRKATQHVIHSAWSSQYSTGVRDIQHLEPNEHECAYGVPYSDTKLDGMATQTGRTQQPTNERSRQQRRSNRAAPTVRKKWKFEVRLKPNERTNERTNDAATKRRSDGDGNHTIRMMYVVVSLCGRLSNVVVALPRCRLVA